MPLEYGELGIIDELEELKLSFDAIDMDKVKRETLRQIAVIMSRKVRDAVIAEPDIQTGGAGPYESGPGPSMGTKEAWLVKPSGKDRFTVVPHPEVEQRAFVLNYGYPGMIRPTTADNLRFTINGVPTFRGAVKGPDPTNYWRAAFNSMEKSGQFERVAENELRKEIEERF